MKTQNSLLSKTSNSAGKKPRKILHEILCSMGFVDRQQFSKKNRAVRKKCIFSFFVS